MKTTLIFADIFSPAIFRLSPIFIRRALLMIALSVVITLSAFALVRTAIATFALSCSEDETMIAYPIYNARGVQIDEQITCGKVRKACTLKGSTARGVPLYECPGLMRPR